MDEFPHNRLQLLIGGGVLLHEAEFSVISVPEQRIRVSGMRVRVVDLALLRVDAPREDVILTPPLLCIEILSQEDRLARAKKVLEDYRLMNVGHAWLIDPLHCCAYAYNADGFHLLASTERLEVAGMPIYLPLDDLFARLD